MTADDDGFSRDKMTLFDIINSNYNRVLKYTSTTTYQYPLHQCILFRINILTRNLISKNSHIKNKAKKENDER